MKKWLDQNPMFALLYAVFFVVAVVGGVLVLFDGAGDLSFQEYTDRLVDFAVAVGILGAGRAVKNGMLGRESSGDGTPPPNEEVAPSEDELLAAFPEDPPSIAGKHGEV